MNKTQEELIKTYYSTFPKDTYQVISKKSGIQNTRVFRIFNGSEMKISEFEAINNLIRNQGKTTSSTFKELSLQCSQILSLDSLSELAYEMSYLLQLKGCL